MTNLLFDLDGTLTEVDVIQTMMGRPEGRNHVIERLGEDYTVYQYPPAVSVLKDFHRREEAAVVTSAPEAYARKILTMIGTKGVPIFASADKPFTNSVRQAMHHLGGRANNTVVIGDSSVDVLAAHGIQAVSIGTTWGNLFPKSLLRRSQPTITESDPENLEEQIALIESGAITYTPRTTKLQFFEGTQQRQGLFSPILLPVPLEELPILNGVEYVPWHRGGASSPDTKRIISLKASKKFTRAQQKEFYATDDYFWNGELRTGQRYSETFDWATRTLERTIKENIPPAPNGTYKNTTIIPVPNSKPWWCYHSDPNYKLAKDLAERINAHFVGRPLQRETPVQETHNGSTVTTPEHLATIGVKNIDHPFSKYFLASRVILVDDVTTSGTQLQIAATLLRKAGYEGQIYGVAIGKTRE